MMPFLTPYHTFWPKFIHLIENIDIQSIYVIGYIDHNNLWWMKLCVYGNVDTNVICHVCKMNYVTHMDQIITWMNLCSWNMHIWKMNFLPKRSWLWWIWQHGRNKNFGWQFFIIYICWRRDFIHLSRNIGWWWGHFIHIWNANLNLMTLRFC